MPDLLIRNVDADTVRQIDTEAQRLGLSRNEYLRREIARLAHRGHRATTLEDLSRSAEALADLADDDVMRDAWS